LGTELKTSAPVNPFMDLALWACQWLDEYFYLALLVFTLIGLYAFKHKRVFVTALLLTALLSPVAKNFYAFDRPCAGVPECPQSYGFPSIHSSVAAVFLVASLGTPWFLFFLPASVAVASSRVFLGVHTVSQAAAGLAFGATIYFFVWLAIHRFKDSRFVKRHGLLE